MWNYSKSWTEPVFNQRYISFCLFDETQIFIQLLDNVWVILSESRSCSRMTSDTVKMLNLKATQNGNFIQTKHLISDLMIWLNPTYKHQPTKPKAVPFNRDETWNYSTNNTARKPGRSQSRGFISPRLNPSQPSGVLCLPTVSSYSSEAPGCHQAAARCKWETSLADTPAGFQEGFLCQLPVQAALQTHASFFLKVVYKLLFVKQSEHIEGLREAEERRYLGKSLRQELRSVNVTMCWCSREQENCWVS